MIVGATTCQNCGGAVMDKEIYACRCNYTTLRVAHELLKLQQKGDLEFRGQSYQLLDLALDLLGVPADNTVETGACDVANATGKWPKWGVCRDAYYNAYQDLVVNQNDMESFLKGVLHETI